MYLRLCGAVVGSRVLVRDPLRRAVQADLLQLGDASFLGPSALTLQLPVRSEAASKPLVQSSIFDFGTVRGLALS